jgi:hypothetical protein
MTGVILSEDIKNITGMSAEKKLDTIVEYIKYMQEQINFWGQNRQKDIDKIRQSVSDLSDIVSGL